MMRTGMLRKRRWAVARVLLLGMGNVLMGDDGLGVHALRALDAVAAGEKPGSLYWLPRECFARARSGRLTLHDDDLLDALDLAALRGFRPTLHVAGMEPLCWQRWSLELSAPVRAAMPGYLDMICRRLGELGTQTVPSGRC